MSDTSWVKLDEDRTALLARLETAVRNDRTDYQNAQDELFFRFGHIDITRNAAENQIKELETQTRAVCKAWCDQFQESFVGQGGENASQDASVGFAGAPEAIQERISGQLQPMTQRLDGAADRLNAVGVESWQGAGADSYRATHHQRVNEIASVRSLVNEVSNALDAVSLIQTALLDNAANVMEDTLICTMQCDDPPKYMNAMSEVDLYNLEVCPRMHAMKTACENAQRRLDEISQEGWTATSQAVGTKLAGAVDLARDWKATPAGPYVVIPNHGSGHGVY